MKMVSCILLGALLTAGAGMAETPSAAKKSRTAPAMSPDMRRAIAFERAKARADARQAAIEAKHPTVFYNQADRTAAQPANRVPDPGPGR